MRSAVSASDILLATFQELAVRLGKAGTEAEAARIADAVLGRLDDDPQMLGIFEQNAIKANLAGQLFVRDVELAAKPIERVIAGRVVMGAPLRLQTEPSTFLDLPFDEAIAHFQSRGVLTPEDFDALIDELKSQAFTARRATTLKVIEAMKARLQTAVAPGGIGLRDFVREFQDSVIAGQQPAASYLENVFRTSTSTSYAAGRLQQQTSPNVIAATGYWQYLAVPDSRVRPAHLDLNGKQWRINDPEGLRAYPPNGYQCRCAMVTIDREDVDQVQLNRRVDVDAAITPGFAGPPTGRG